MGYDYTINYFNEFDSQISTFTLKSKDPCCVITMCHTKITLPGAASRPNIPARHIALSKLNVLTSSDYSLVDQHGKTLTQISIMDLLCASPQH